MPADESTGRRFRLRFFLPAVLLGGLVIAAILAASPLAPDGTVDGNIEAATSARDLRVGECFDLEETDAGTITDVITRPCDREHQYEVFLNDSLTGVGYPTDDDFDVYFDDRCVPGFLDYVGAPYETSVLGIYWLVPSREGWRQGDRTVQCAVHHPDVPRLTAPLKDVGPAGPGLAPPPRPRRGGP